MDLADMINEKVKAELHIPVLLLHEDVVVKEKTPDSWYVMGCNDPLDYMINTDMYMNDGKHLNDKGYRALARKYVFSAWDRWVGQNSVEKYASHPRGQELVQSAAKRRRHETKAAKRRKIAQARDAALGFQKGKYHKYKMEHKYQQHKPRPTRGRYTASSTIFRPHQTPTSSRPAKVPTRGRHTASSTIVRPQQTPTSSRPAKIPTVHKPPTHRNVPDTEEFLFYDMSGMYRDHLKDHPHGYRQGNWVPEPYYHIDDTPSRYAHGGANHHDYHHQNDRRAQNGYGYQYGRHGNRRY